MYKNIVQVKGHITLLYHIYLFIIQLKTCYQNVSINPNLTLTLTPNPDPNPNPNPSTNTNPNSNPNQNRWAEQ